jgi:tetratricopeptide (TPR) repeat protein
MGRSTVTNTTSTKEAGFASIEIDETRSQSTFPHHLWYSRGKMLTQKGHYEAALTSFDNALKIQPNEHQIWIYRGIVLTHLNHYESALVSFSKALEIMPSNREAWIFHGAVLTYLNRPHEAMKSYTTALSIQQQGFTPCERYPMWLPVSFDKLLG